MALVERLEDDIGRWYVELFSCMALAFAIMHLYIIK